MKINNDATQAPGADVAEEMVTLPTITSYLKRDLSVAISCLNAIQSDPDLLNAMAQFMHGRFMNSRHKEEVSKQNAPGPFPVE